MKEQQFAAYVNQKNSKELHQEMNALQKKLDAIRKRNGELSMLLTAGNCGPRGRGAAGKYGGCQSQRQSFEKSA